MKKVTKSFTTGLLWVLTFCSGTVYAQETSTENRSSINITNPTSSTVWEIPELAELQWTTQNMDTTKSIRFFLVRNKTVVQELGRFKNNGHVTGIRLAKNINSGNSYQVMGIELFPSKKEQVAKFVTPFFTIRNRESDERKRQSELARNSTLPYKKQDKLTTLSANVQTKASPIRKEFEGRRISYVKNLSFESEHLKVKIWDHEKEDGDIVSIYLNGELVLSKHLLTNDLREFDIELDPAKPNDLLLYAHNLGEVSPNTVSVEIASAGKAETITLNSYLRSCEAVLISVKK